MVTNLDDIDPVSDYHATEEIKYETVNDKRVLKKTSEARVSNIYNDKNGTPVATATARGLAVTGTATEDTDLPNLKQVREADGRAMLALMDNATGYGTYDFNIADGSSAGVTISWEGVLLVTSPFITGTNNFCYLVANSGTKSITLTATNNVCYVKTSDFSAGGVLPVYYCDWKNDILKESSVIIIAQKNKTYFFADCSGLLPEFYRGLQGYINDQRITTLEESLGLVPFTVADNESQNLFLRGNKFKDYITTKKYGIMVMSQSQLDGRVDQADAPSWLDQAEPSLAGVNMWNRGTEAYETFELGVNTGSANNATTLWGADMVLYYLLQQHLADDIYVVKTTIGGSALSTLGNYTGGYWQPYEEKISTGLDKYTQIHEQKVRTAGKDALASNIEIKCLIWYQGEGDVTPLAAAEYYQNQKNLIAYTRGVINNKTLPVIIPTVPTNSGQYSQTVQDAKIQLASEDPHVYLIDVGSATLLDAYHLDADSSETLGTNMFDILKDF